MAIALTGHAQVESTTNSSTASVTVPVGTNYVLIFFQGWIAAALSMSTMSLGGVGASSVFAVARSGDVSAYGAFGVYNSGTGSQTFAWDWSGTSAIGEGGIFKFAFFSGVHASTPTRDADGQAAANEGTTKSVTLDSNTGDAVYGFAYSADEIIPDINPGGSGQSADDETQTANNFGYSLGHEDTPGASSTTFTCGAVNYGGLVAVTLIPAADAGVTGTIAATMRAGTFAGTGAQQQTGAVAATMQAAVASLTGFMVPTGAIEAAMQAPVMSASGTVANVLGAIAASLQKMAAALTGETPPYGQIDATMQALLADLTGAQAQSGSVAAAMQPVVFEGEGAQPFTGQIAASMQPLTASFTGSHGSVEGAMAAVMQVAVFAASGVMHPKGIIAAAMQALLFAGQGQQPFSGTLSAQLQALLFAAAALTETLTPQGHGATVRPLDLSLLAVNFGPRHNLSLAPVGFAPKRMTETERF